MPTDTQLHGLTRPDKFTLEWHIPLNDNFTYIDQRLTAQDVEANLTTYPPLAGAEFRATDTGAIYVGDGVNWSLADRSFSDVEVRTATIRDIGSDPTTAGEMTRNGSDVIVHSGGTPVNLSDIPTAVQSDDANRLDVQDTAPSNPSVNDLWLNTSP